MGKLRIYVDASVVGGCEDPEFSSDSRALWERFIAGTHVLVLSSHTMEELQGAPSGVRNRLEEVPNAHMIVLAETSETRELAAAYLSRGVVGPGSEADARHVALATIGRVDVLVSWNFKHMVNLGRIRRSQAVNIERGYGMIEIRTPKEVLDYEE